MGAHRLDGIKVMGAIKEHLYDEFPSHRVIEENEEGPVDQPCSLLEKLETVVAKVVWTGIYTFSEFVDVFEGGIPVLGEDFGCQFAP